MGALECCLSVHVNRKPGPPKLVFTGPGVAEKRREILLQVDDEPCRQGSLDVRAVDEPTPITVDLLARL